MHRAGVEFLAGTDTGNPYCFPGFGLHDELAWLVRAGFSPVQALQAATLNPARFMGREQELGTVAPGKLADLVLLDANPLADIANTRKLAGVVFAGQFYPKSSLDEMLAKIETSIRNSKPPIAEALWRTIGDQGIAAAVAQYRNLRTASPEGYDFSEEQLNTLGYGLLGAKRVKDAIEILKLNVEAYPQSANVYDSLGEAYMTDGAKELAIQNYEKSLARDPANHGAREKLKQLRAP